MHVARNGLSLDEAPAAAPEPEPVIIAAQVRPVTQADLDVLRPKLLDRLRDKYPDANDASIFFWMLSAIGSSEYIAIRSEHAIGMMALRQVPLVRPYVQEIFVIALNGRGEEAAALYPHFLRWAKLHGAPRMVVDKCSDATRAMIGRALGMTLERDVLISARLA